MKCEICGKWIEDKCYDLKEVGVHHSDGVVCEDCFWEEVLTDCNDEGWICQTCGKTEDYMYFHDDGTIFCPDCAWKRFGNFATNFNDYMEGREE